MARRLPPLNALRAFEAAARHLSFTQAASELNVTQAAISHQVKALEAWLGVALFRRLNRVVRLTEEGQAYLPAVREALDSLAEATGRLLSGEESRTLTVSTLDSFAVAWLLPRLKRFRALHPEIDVRITPSDHLVDFGREEVDMAIRYGRGDWPGLTSRRFMTEDMFPVCSPRLLETGPPLNSPSDLARHTLLHDDMAPDWRTWLLAAGADDLDPTRGPFFSHSHLVIQAAIDGQGVALGRSALVADALADGRLVRPLEVSLPVRFAYYIVYPERFAARTAIQAFSAWLMAEANQRAIGEDAAGSMYFRP